MVSFRWKILIYSFIMLFQVITASKLLAVDLKEVKGLISKEGIIPEATIYGNIKIGKYGYAGPWYAIEEQRRGNCYKEEDLDGDGEKELVILYYEKSSSDEYLNCFYLCIYKKIDKSWSLQYKKEYGAAVLNSFLTEKLFTTKNKQIIIELGTGASIGYNIDVTNWDGKKYVSLIDSSELTGGIVAYDIENDGIKEILCYQRYAPLPLIYQWDDKNKNFEVMNDSEKLFNYYRKVIEILKDPLNEKGEYDAKYAWALFECYYKLGDYEKATHIGSQLIEYAVKLGGGWNFYDTVKDKLVSIEKRQEMDKKIILYETKLKDKQLSYEDRNSISKDITELWIKEYNRSDSLDKILYEEMTKVINMPVMSLENDMTNIVWLITYCDEIKDINKRMRLSEELYNIVSRNDNNGYAGWRFELAYSLIKLWAQEIPNISLQEIKSKLNWTVNHNCWKTDTLDLDGDGRNEVFFGVKGPMGDGSNVALTEQNGKVRFIRFGSADSTEVIKLYAIKDDHKAKVILFHSFGGTGMGYSRAFLLSIKDGYFKEVFSTPETRLGGVSLKDVLNNGDEVLICEEKIKDRVLYWPIIYTWDGCNFEENTLKYPAFLVPYYNNLEDSKAKEYADEIIPAKSPEYKVFWEKYIETLKK